MSLAYCVHCRMWVPAEQIDALDVQCRGHYGSNMPHHEMVWNGREFVQSEKRREQYAKGARLRADERRRTRA